MEQPGNKEWKNLRGKWKRVLPFINAVQKTFEELMCYTQLFFHYQFHTKTLDDARHWTNI